jgi:hypothetical protein
MCKLQEGYGASSTHAHDCDVKAAEGLLTCITKSKTLSVEPGQFLRWGGCLWEEAHRASDYADSEPTFLSGFGPDTAGSYTRGAGNHDRAMRSCHLMKKGRHEPGITMVISNRKPWVRRARVGVDRNHRQSTVTRRANDTVQSNGVEPKLVCAPNQITLRWYLDHVTG